MNAYETILAIETTSTALFNLYAIQNLQRRRSFSRNFHSSYYYYYYSSFQQISARISS